MPKGQTFETLFTESIAFTLFSVIYKTLGRQINLINQKICYMT